MADTTTRSKSNGIVDVIVPIPFLFLCVTSCFPFYEIVIKMIVGKKVFNFCRKAWTIYFKKSCSAVAYHVLFYHVIYKFRSLRKLEHFRHDQQVKSIFINKHARRDLFVCLDQTHTVIKMLTVARNFKQRKVGMASTIIKQIGINDAYPQLLLSILYKFAAINPPIIFKANHAVGIWLRCMARLTVCTARA